MKWRVGESKFNDSKSGNSKRTQWRIAVAGIGKSVGVTHFSILLGAYFRYQAGKKVCIVNLSGENEYMELEHLYFGHRLERSEGYHYTIRGIDFFVGQSVERLITDALQGKYEVVIFDCGTKRSLLERALALCDRKYVLGCCSPWNQRQWELYFGLEPQAFKELRMAGYRFGYSFGAEENASVLEGQYHVKFLHIPFVEDPFKIKREQIRRLQELV